MLPRPEDLDDLLATPIPRDPRRPVSRAWEIGILAVVIGSIWVASLLHGVDVVTVAVAAALSGVILLGEYFMSRDLAGPPSRTEIVLAMGWRAIRALVGLTGALVFVGAPIVALLRGGFGKLHAAWISMALLGLVLGLISLRIGLFGRWRKMDAMLRARHRRGFRAASGP